jgi:methylmalonyl-CoA/ethylmalonyl-CoA epimerase
MGINVTSVDHVVIAVNDLDAAVETYQNTYGLTMSDRHPNPGGFEAALFPIGDCLLELVMPNDDNERNAVKAHIDRKGEGLFILSLAVSDIDAAVADLRAKGTTVTDPAGDENKVAFVSPKNAHGARLQLIQRG